MQMEVSTLLELQPHATVPGVQNSMLAHTGELENIQVLAVQLTTYDTTAKKLDYLTMMLPLKVKETGLLDVIALTLRVLLCL
jgi:hypothetical protein